MTGHGEKLSRKKEVAIAALISEPTILQAARIAEVSEASLWRWLKLPEFAEEYRQAKGTVIKHAISRLQLASEEAVSVLREIMKDSESPASTRVNATKAIIDLSLRAFETEELETRIIKLEDKQ